MIRVLAGPAASTILAVTLAAAGAGAGGALGPVLLAAAALAAVQAVENLVPRHSVAPLTHGLPSDGLQAWCLLRRRPVPPPPPPPRGPLLTRALTEMTGPEAIAAALCVAGCAGICALVIVGAISWSDVAMWSAAITLLGVRAFVFVKPRQPPAAGWEEGAVRSVQSWRPVFDRFTEPTRHAVVFSQEEARSLRNNHIGTEHILLGLLRIDDAAARVLNSLGITLERARPQVRRIIGSASGITSGQIPFTPRARTAFELAHNEAATLGVDYVDPGRLLLGILRDADGIAVRVLHKLGADAQHVREAVGPTPPDPGPTVLHPAAPGVRATVQVAPGPVVDRLVRLAAAQALEHDRSEIAVDDILIALVRDRDTAPILHELGIDEPAIQAVLHPRSTDN